MTDAAHTSGTPGTPGTPDEDPSGHVPVLVEEVLTLLAPGVGEVAVDCTAGRGGHARAIAQRIGPRGVIVLNDADEDNLSFAAARVRAMPDPPRVEALHGSFVDVPRRLAALGVAADVVLADLGFASTHTEDPDRGFSFSRDGPLDMRYDRAAGVTAATLVNTLPEDELASILRDYGEERQARRIARKLVERRAEGPIDTTVALADVVRSVLGPPRRRPGPSRSARGRIDPATRVFQALRIAVNDELASLRLLLEAVTRTAQLAGVRRGAGGARDGWLAGAARVGVISFHSLEDREVKRSFAALAERGLAAGLTARPIEAGDDEVRRNPRSRSAKLRAVRLGPRQVG